MPMWLLESSVKQAIESAKKAGFVPNAEQFINFQARFTSDNNGNSPGERILTTVGGNAEILVEGVLTESPDFFAMFFGGGNTIYSDIISAIALVEQDENINNVDFLFKTPGGSVEGMFDAIDAIRAMTKPTTGIIKNAASAGFGLASQVDNLIAKNKSSMMGSIGILASVELDDNVIDITSSNAPNKRPDVTTAKGKAVIRAQIDPLEDLFINAIAEGRNVTAKKVIADFGKGSTLIAVDALKRGMIDSIAESPIKNTVSKPRNNIGNTTSQETIIMNASELKAQHPDVYATVIAEGKQLGVVSERDRVVAHLTMGDSSGDMKTAIDAVKDGSEMTATTTAIYMSAIANRNQLKDRVADDIDANAGDGVADTDDVNTDTVVSLVEKNFGIGA